MNRIVPAACTLLLAVVSTAGADSLYIRLNLDNVFIPMAKNPAGQPNPANPVGPTNPPAQPPVSPTGSTPQAITAFLQSVAKGNIDLTAPWIGAFVEVKKAKMYAADLVEIDHPWGKRALVPISPLTKISILPVSIDPFAKMFEREMKDALKSKDAEKLFRLAEKAFAHNHTQAFQTALDEAAKIAPDDPRTKNYDRVRKALEKPFNDINPYAKALAEEMQKDGYRRSTSDGGHYILLSKPGVQTSAALKHRLARMEETLRNFYIWFALQKDLPQPALPKYSLLAVLVGTTDEFGNLHAAWGAPLMVADGFISRRDNVMFLSARPLDPAYDALVKGVDRTLQPLTGVTREEFLSGNVWNRPWPAARILDVSRTQTLVLLQKAVEDETERAAISHEGTRQLLTASELFPRHVQVPEWAMVGFASYFAVPANAVYPGVGLPNWSDLISFKYFRSTGSLKNGAAVLYSVADDRYFHDATRSINEWQDNKDNQALARKAHRDLELARSTSWALVYYLVQSNKLPLLLRYSQELEQLPRDLDLDERALQGAFARAFDLSTNLDVNRLDPTSVNRFAHDWFDGMSRVNLELADIELLFRQQRATEVKTPAEAGGRARP